MMFLKRLGALALLLAGLVAPAYAQQAAAHSIVVGRGPGFVGFDAIPSAANTKFLVGGGVGSNPAFATMSGDCTLAAGAVTCTKTSGSSFATVATSGSASDLGTGTLPNARLDAEVQCVAGLVSAADKIAYYTGSGTCALADFPAAMRTLLTTSSSANLAAFLSDETGSGAAVFGTAPQISTIELGNASDTTRSRASGGTLAVEGVNVLTTATGQPLDSDLTTIAGLTATTDNFIQSKSSAWASRTPAQVTADLSVCAGGGGTGAKGLVPAQVAGDVTKFLRGDCTFVSIPGGGDALVANPLSQFAATTSAQLAGVISDETGSGAAVFGTAPQISTIELRNASDTTLARVSAGVASIEGSNIIVSGDALGTPASGTLTNATGLPVSGITSSTSTALGVGSLEVGAASDTTVARSAAGVVSVEGVPLYSGIPQNSQSAAYTLVLADAQEHIYHPSGDNNARTFTIPANGSVAYPVGTVVTFINEINTVTIAITSDTLLLCGTGSTGSRSLAANGLATAVKVTSTRWYICGTGLT